MRLIVSFSPHRVERQQACIESWRRVGARVIAVQHERDMENTEKHFAPDELYQTNLTGDLFGKPYHVRISALMQHCTIEPGILINSDIEIRDTVEEFSQKWTPDKKHFTVGIRTDETRKRNSNRCTSMGLMRFW